VREEYDRPRHDPALPDGDADGPDAPLGAERPDGLGAERPDGSLDLPDNWLLSHDPAWPEYPTDPGGDTGTDLPAAAFSAYPAVRYRDEAIGGAAAPPGLAADLLGPADERPSPRRTRLQRGIGKAFMIFGGTVVVLLLVYMVDLVSSIGDVPRGVSVAGVEVGGMPTAEAEAKLREELGPRLTDPMPVRAGDVTTQLDPADAGLGVDWAGTVEQAGNQPIDPISRVTSLLTSREIGVVTSADDDRLKEAVTRLAHSEIDHQVREGNVGFRTVTGQGTDPGTVEPFPIFPRQGQWLADVEGAMHRIKSDWLAGNAVHLDVAVTEAKTSRDGVQQAVEQTEPLVSAPVTVKADDTSATLTPKHIADAMKHTPGQGGALQLTVDRASLQEVLAPQLRDTERTASDAEIVFAGSRPSVEPSEQGRTIDWERTFAPFITVAGKDGERTLDVVYEVQEPDVSTKDLRELGIKEVVGEFTTGGLGGAAARNVATMADAVTGAVVRPGETFRLSELTGPRTASQGYVEAPVNEDGTGPAVIGGGSSQLTSTLYNAAYGAGLKDAGHTPHETYLDRYPAGRDAVAVLPDGSSAELAFTNNMRNGIAVQVTTSGSDVTVRLWGTEQFDVSASTGERTDVQSPPVRRDNGPRCEATSGAEGFKVTDTRVVKERGSGRVVDRQSTAVTYDPVPRVVCGSRPSQGPRPTPRPDPVLPIVPGSDTRSQQVDRGGPRG